MHWKLLVKLQMKAKKENKKEAFYAPRSSYRVRSKSNCNGESTEQLPFIHVVKGMF